MRHTVAEKYETIRLVEGSDLPVRQTLRALRVNRSTSTQGDDRRSSHDGNRSNGGHWRNANVRI